MRICAAQTRPSPDQVPTNITNHLRLIESAVERKADAIVFPELSLTGYEPKLAQNLALSPDDDQLEDFQSISNRHALVICVGLPVQTSSGLHIGMLQFHPEAPRRIYPKSYLHADEAPYFAPGPRPNPASTFGQDPTVALAICYELSVEAHAQRAAEQGADVYVASAVKAVEATAGALARMSDISRTYEVAALFANSVGLSEGIRSGGKSSVWNHSGDLIGQLDDESEGFLLFDTETENVVIHSV